MNVIRVHHRRWFLGPLFVGIAEEYVDWSLTLRAREWTLYARGRFPRKRLQAHRTNVCDVTVALSRPRTVRP